MVYRREILSLDTFFIRFYSTYVLKGSKTSIKCVIITTGMFEFLFEQLTHNCLQIQFEYITWFPLPPV